MGSAAQGFVAECYWPSVTEAQLVALDRQVTDAVADLAPENECRYLGSMLLREDEMVFCQFEGHAETVRMVVERARVPYERILAASRSPWPTPNEEEPN